MKEFRAEPGGGIDSLRINDVPTPSPGEREVLIRIRASSVNYRELMIIMQNNYVLPLKENLVPLCDGAGEVVGIGKGVRQVRIGDRVSTIAFPYWLGGRIDPAFAAQLGGSVDGTLREFMVLNELSVVRTPSNLSDIQAATLPCAGLTAWNALTGGRVTLPGDDVLVIGSGGVSLFALQFAKLFGARVIATTSSNEKAGRLRQFGADHVINYVETPEWHQEVRRYTNGRGVDHVIDVGGNSTFEKSIKSCAIGGEVALIGTLSEEPATIEAMLLFRTNVSVRPIAIGNREQQIAMNRAVEVNNLEPIIDSEFSFEQFGDALHRMSDASRMGKIVIRH